MISIDTETTGLWWQHGTEAFAIGWYDGKEYKSITRRMNPLTRAPEAPLDDYQRNILRDILFDNDMVIFHNANYDLKAFARMGVIDWDEPNDLTFWENIYDLGSINHLFDSRDSGAYDSSLKALAPKYLSKDYESQEKMMKLINRCRNFIRLRNGRWKIGDKKTVPQGIKEFGHGDMWLPLTLMEKYPDQEEMKKYFKDDYVHLSGVTNRYLKDDCVYTYELAEGFLAELFEDQGAEFVEHHLAMNHDLAPVVWKMETQGLHIHSDQIDQGIATCEEWIKKTHEVCMKMTGKQVAKFTPAILRKYLFEECGLEPITYTEKANLPQVDAKRLLLLKEQCEERDLPEANRFLSNLLANGKYTTKKQYLEGYRRVKQRNDKVPYKLPEANKDWYLFPSLKSTGTGTTRFTSANPNSQNIEKAGNPFEDEFDDVREMLEASPKLRSVFGPAKGYWWFPCDYKQLQLRIFAALTGEESLIQSFRDGWDFHDFMAHAIFDLPESQTPTSAQRRVAKAVNFGFIFGASEKKVDATTGRPGLYEELMRMFPNAKEFLIETKEQIQESGLVYTMGGYPLKIPQRITPWDARLTYAAHMGVCYRVQGTEGEIVKKAMVDCDNYMVDEMEDSRIVMQIHDEIVFQTPAKPPKKHIRHLSQIMEQAGAHFGVETPVDVELCQRSLDRKVSVIL
jgi:DNA polymerase I-like protein with 3'-5' exonuclease and polymerase domains